MTSSKSAKGRFSYASSEEPEKTGEKIKPEVPAKTEVITQYQSASKVKEPAPQQLNTPQIDSRQALKNPAAYALPPQRKGRRGDEGGLKRTDVPREQLNVRIRPELKRAAAGLAGLQGMTLGDVVEAALIEYLKAAQDET